MGLWISTTHINATEGHQIGEEEPWETWLNSKNDLFRYLRSEYGGCIGRMYKDSKVEDAIPIGWVFRRRRTYEDIRSLDSETYDHEVWVELLAGPDTVVRTRHHVRLDTGKEVLS